MSLKYRVLLATSCDELEAMVAELIIDGWKPLGGVSISITEFDEYCYDYYAQAMVRGRGLTFLEDADKG